MKWFKRAASYLGTAYFKPKSFERSGKLYEALGMHRVNKVLERLNPVSPAAERLSDSNIEVKKGWFMDPATLHSIDTVTRVLETLHLAAIPVSLLLFSSPVNAGIWAAINAYVVGVHRYNRARIHSILDKLSKRKSKQS